MTADVGADAHRPDRTATVRAGRALEMLLIAIASTACLAA